MMKQKRKMEDMDLGRKNSALREFDAAAAFGEKKFKKTEFLARKK